MINISLTKTNDYVSGFIVEGHSTYAEHGKDIICASVSALSQTILLTLVDIYGDKCKYITRSGYLKLELLDEYSLKEVQLLFRAFVVGIKAIAEEYPKYIKLSK